MSMKKRMIVLMSGWLLGTCLAAHANPAKQYTVQKEGERVYQIAYENGIQTQAIIAANNLTPPYLLKAGQILIIPSPNEHIVGRGENLSDIANRHGVNVDVLAQENNISGPDGVKAGNILILPSRDTEAPSAYRTPQSTVATSSLAPLPLVKVAPALQKRQEEHGHKEHDRGLSEDLAAELRQEKENFDSSSEDSEPKKKLKLVKEEPTLEKKEPEKKAKKEEKKKKAAEEKKEKAEDEPKKETKKEAKKETLFIWPAEGTVIGEFGASGKDGINIDLPVGTNVKASAGGKVLYAGSELKDLGQLLLVSHDDGWITAYAHLSELQVGKGDKVKKGQVIALSGKTGAAKQPQLHFEIRKGKKPIDPLGKLSQ